MTASAAGSSAPEADLKKKLQKSLSMTLNFGDGATVKPVDWLLRLMAWDSSMAGYMKTWMATRGVPVDDPEIGDDLRAKLALKLFENRKEDAALDPQFSIGMALHQMREPKMPFPPGTLFEQREVVPGKGNAPRTVRISDTSSTWESVRKRVAAGGYLHIANIHRDALLAPIQAKYVTALSDDRLTLDTIKDLALPGRLNLGADAVVAALDPVNDQKTYWASPGHVSAYAEALDGRTFYSFMHVATFREYCEFLWDAAKAIWVIGRGGAKLADLQKFRSVAQLVPDRFLQDNDNREALGEVYAGMLDLAQYLRAAGASSRAAYFASAGRWTPGQQNLLDVAYYWVTHISDVTDTHDNVGRDENAIMARYLNACYDLLNWAGSAGLFAFHKVGTPAIEEVDLITDPGDAIKIKTVKSDLQAIAESEGLVITKLASEETEFTRNPRLHARTPWSSLTGPKQTLAGADETINCIEKNLLYYRIKRIFELLRLWNWKEFTVKGVGDLVRKAREYAERDQDPAQKHKSGFAWIRIALVRAKKKNPVVVNPPGGKKARRKANARQTTLSEPYLNMFQRLSYRYIVNYVGGHLHFFRQYMHLGTRQGADFWIKYCKDLNPLNRWRFYLEINYMITLLTQRTTPKEDARNMAKLIQEVLPVLLGTDAFAEIEQAVKKVKVDPVLVKDTVVKEYQDLITKGDWVELVDRLFNRMVAKRARERGIASVAEDDEGEKNGDTAQAGTQTPRQKYFADLQDASRIFLQNRLGQVLLLRHFYRSLYFYLPPEVPDFLPPMFLDKPLDEQLFNLLLDQEAIAARYLGRRPTGGKFRIRVVIPLEIADLLARVVIDPETGKPLPDLLVNPPTGSREDLAELPKDLKDRNYRLILRFYQPSGTEICYAINEHVWHATQHELNRRLGNHVHNCQALAARIARSGKQPKRFDKAVDVIAKVVAQQTSVIQTGNERHVAIIGALLAHLPDSLGALAALAFCGRLPKGFLTALKKVEKVALSDTTTFEVGAMARHLRNLMDASEADDASNTGETVANTSYTFEGTFPHALGQKLNRRRLGPRLDRAFRLASAPYRGDDSRQGKRVRDIFAWAKSKRLLLHMGQVSDVRALPPFRDVWGDDDPVEVADDLATDAKDHMDQFTDNYPNFKQFPTYPGGMTPPTTRAILDGTEEATGDKGTKEKEMVAKTPSRDAILLTIMRALVLQSEQDPPEEANLAIQQVVPNVRAKLLRMIYAHEFLMAQAGDDAKRMLAENDLREGGLRCLVEMPALIPSIAFAKTLGWVISDIVRNPWVVEQSLQQPLPPKVGTKDVPVDDKTGQPITLEQAETHKLKSFTSERKNYGDAVQEILGILAVTQACGVSEADWARFAREIHEKWATRVKVLATAGWDEGDEEEEGGEGTAGEDGEEEEEEAESRVEKDLRIAGLLESQDVFQRILDPVKKAFNTFAKTIEAGLNNMASGIARSLDPGNGTKLKPLPLPLSAESPTIAQIQPFSTIEADLRAGVAVPVTDVLKDLKLVTAGKSWHVSLNDSDQVLTGAFRPGAIPLVVTGFPLTETQARKYDGYFKNQNLLRPEIGIERHCTGERDARSGKLSAWKRRYTKKAREAKTKIKEVLATMHSLRTFKLAIEQRLASRTDTVLDLVRLGFNAGQVAQGLLERDMGILEGGNPAGLNKDETAIVKKFLASWTAGHDDPASVAKEVAKSIQPDNPADPGARVDHFIGYASGAGKRAGKLKKLLGGLSVRTWNKGELIKAAARGDKLTGIIHVHLTRLGLHLRDLRAQRDFALVEDERIKRVRDDESRAQAGLATTAFTGALMWLRDQALFMAYRDGPLLPCEVPLAIGPPACKEKNGKNGEKDKNDAIGEKPADPPAYTCRGRLLGKVLARCTLDALQIQVPLYPAGSVAANVLVKGPMLIAHEPTSLAKWQEKEWNTLKQELVAGLDINQLNCARTVCPGLVKIARDPKRGNYPTDPETKVEDWDFPFADWARLADVFDYTQDRPNEYLGKEKRSKGGGTKMVYPAASFYCSVMSAAFTPAGSAIGTAKADAARTKDTPDPSVTTTTQPSESAPYDIYAATVPLNFRDLLGALMKYRGAKHNHLERKKPAIIRKMRKTTDHRLFLNQRTALYFMNRACNRVRDADLNYMFHAIHYHLARSGAATIAHERLSLQSPGEEGGPTRIVASMLKNFKPAKNFLVRQFTGLGRPPKKTPKTAGVSPAYTSQTCNYCARRGVKGILDDSASSNHAPCSKCRRIYDRHGSAASNVPDRFIRRKKKRKKTRT